MASSIRVDESCPPILLTAFTGRQTPDDVEAYVACMDAIQERGQPYIGISLMLRYRSDTTQMKRVARWIADTDEVSRRLCICNAIVAPNVGFRFLISGLTLIQPMPVPFEIVADEEAAADWVERFMVTHPVAAPLGMRRYLRKEMERSRQDVRDSDSAARAERRKRKDSRG